MRLWPGYLKINFDQWAFPLESMGYIEEIKLYYGSFIHIFKLRSPLLNSFSAKLNMFYTCLSSLRGGLDGCSANFPAPVRRFF